MEEATGLGPLILMVVYNCDMDYRQTAESADLLHDVTAQGNDAPVNRNRHAAKDHAAKALVPRPVFAQFAATVPGFLPRM